MKYLLTFLLTFSFSAVFSQNGKIDSLQLEVSNANGKNHILQLNQLAHAYWDVDTKKSIALCNEALQLCDKHKEYKEKSNTYNIISGAYFMLNNPIAADKYCDSSLFVSRKYGNDNVRMKALSNKILFYSLAFKVNNFNASNYLNELFELCRKKGEYDFFADAVRNLLTKKLSEKDKKDFNLMEYLESLEKNADNKLKPIIYMLYSTSFNMDKQYFKAIEMLKKTLTVTKEKFVRINCYELLGNIYCNIRRFKDGQKYYLEALKICDEYKDIKLFSHKEDIYFYLSMLYVELQDYKQAYKYATIPTLDGCGEYPERTCFEYCNLAKIYLGLDSLGKAEYLLNKSMSISDSLNYQWLKMICLQTKVKLLKKQSRYKNLHETIMTIAQIIENEEEVYTKYEAYQQLTDYYKHTGDYKKSLYYLEKWVVVNDTIKSRESFQVFNEFQTKYETEKKEQQIVIQEQKLKSKNKLLLISSVSGVLILIALILIWLLYNKRNQAYKLLVLQNINCTKESSMSIPEIVLNSNNQSCNVQNIEIKATQMSDQRKQQLFETLTQQIDSKVFLQPDININKMAELCYTNRTYLSQLINEYYQMNFSTLINKCRIEEAKRILIAEKNDVQLKNFYPKLGFNSYGVFNDAFKKHIGVTPAFFLQTVRSEND